jgi:FtsP/CotA-like multicopper oxidase with cupredoxin domain
MKPSKAFFLLALATSLIDVAVADAIVKGLMDPDGQPKFEVPVAEALAITFKIILPNGTLSLNAYSIKQATGLKDPYGKPLMTPVFGYGVSARKASWPGPTLEATNSIKSIIQWGNNLVNITSHPFTSLANLSVVDPTLHWAYSLPGYDGYNFKRNGIPTVTHLHGSHSDPNMDGYPESFYTPNWAIMGPAWKFKKYLYPNNQPATTLWYHDHALGITRLNVYSGLAGFYIIRDNFDTGRQDNPLHLPAGDYEKAYAIQDRMFKTNGELFYPAYKGEPNYDDFIQGTQWYKDRPDNPTAFAEFFGDFMLVNGKIWPKQVVEPRRYRLRLLNACDSRFLVVNFLAVSANTTDITVGQAVTHTVIGSDQGLSNTPISAVSRSVIAPGSRLDIVIDFHSYQGKRIIMANGGGDMPFGDDIPGIETKVFKHTDLVMAFDVKNMSDVPDNAPSWVWSPEVLVPVKPRRVGLFEGLDVYGRLQPLLGGEKDLNIVETFTWCDPTTETIRVNQTEEWEIWNFSGDAVSYSNGRVQRPRPSISHGR